MYRAYLDILSIEVNQESFTLILRSVLVTSHTFHQIENANVKPILSSEPGTVFFLWFHLECCDCSEWEFPGQKILILGVFWVWPPPRIPVTTRIVTFLAGDSYKPSFATVTGRGRQPSYILREIWQDHGPKKNIIFKKVHVEDNHWQLGELYLGKLPFLQRYDLSWDFQKLTSFLQLATDLCDFFTCVIEATRRSIASSRPTQWRSIETH